MCPGATRENWQIHKYKSDFEYSHIQILWRDWRPEHCLVRRIAIDHQHPTRLGHEVVLDDCVTATGIQQIAHRVQALDQLQLPAVSLLAFHGDEHRPPRLIASMQISARVPLLEGLVNRPQQDFQPPQAIGDGAGCKPNNRHEFSKRSVGR